MTEDRLPQAGTITSEIDMILRLLTKNLELSSRDTNNMDRSPKDIDNQVEWTLGYQQALTDTATEIRRMRETLVGAPRVTGPMDRPNDTIATARQ